MSGRKLVFAFKDGLNLALRDEKAPAGGVIDFDMDYSQVDIDYEGPLLDVVGHEETANMKSLMKIKRREPGQTSGHGGTGGFVDSHLPARRHTQLPSMISTPGGDLVTASIERPPDAPLGRTKRRNANRRKRRLLDRMERRQARETATELSPIFEEIHEPEMKETEDSSPATQTEPECFEEAASPVDLMEEIFTGCPTCNSDFPRQLTATGAFSECPQCHVLHLEEYGTYEAYAATLLARRNGEHPDVEPYVPQFVQPPPRRGVPDYIMAKIRRVRKEEFQHYDIIQGKAVNILEGLELYTDVFSRNDERKILDCIDSLQIMGRAGHLKKKTYSEPRKWKRGKGRVTIQCGCCYNFAEDRQGNPPGILQHDEVDPLPPRIKKMIKRMIEWHILPADCIPNSCIINIYEDGDCIPPHIDHHDFVRPFCTVSFISESDILFGREIQIVGPGEFRGTTRILLPVGSVLVLKGNGADLAKHCIPGVRGRRISVTFRRMDENKAPFYYRPDPELESFRPLPL